MGSWLKDDSGLGEIFGDGGFLWVDRFLTKPRFLAKAGFLMA